jgi:hypothetical protein
MHYGKHKSKPIAADLFMQHRGHAWRQPVRDADRASKNLYLVASTDEYENALLFGQREEHRESEPDMFAQCAIRAAAFGLSYAEVAIRN